MNRRQKIIVSVTGIFLVLLLLVGLTYAYFLTQITGNTNNKSISVSTANLAVVYGDGNQVITGDKILPGTTLDEKTFTVTNEGNATSDYAVLIENVKVTYAETITVDGVTQTAGTSTTFESNDFVYTLTCITDDEEECNGVTYETTFPINGGVVVGNSIDVGVTHNYTLTVTYKDTGVDQSADMNKLLEAKVNITDLSTTNPYSGDETLLAYNIINNAISLTQTQKEAGYAELLSTPITKVGTETGEYISTRGYEYPEEENLTNTTAIQVRYWTYASDYTVNQEDGTFNLVDPKTCQYNDGTCHEILVGKYIVSNSPPQVASTSDTLKNTENLTNIYKIIDAPEASDDTIQVKYKKIGKMVESTLSATQDDYGTSYYYRGAVKNNYLTFNNMCWRIVRIEGDGAIRIVLADGTAECSTETLTKIDSAFIGTGNYGYDDNYYADYENSAGRTTSMKYKFNEWLNGTLEDGSTLRFSDANKERLRLTTACIENANGRLEKLVEPSLVCMGEKTSETKIYPLTAEEIEFAGGVDDQPNLSYYLLSNAKNEDINSSWLTLSDWYDSAYGIHSNYGHLLYGYQTDAEMYLRPAVSLVSGTKIASGDGSIENPYVIAD